MLRLGIVLTLLALSTAAVLAIDTSPLEGELFIAGKTPVDPPRNEPKNTHGYVTITGPAAMRMYQAMRGKAADDLCQSGYKVKRAGKLSCSLGEGGKKAACDFSIDLIRGTLADGRPC